MKVVIYHTDASIAKTYQENIYQKLILGLKNNVNSFGFPLIHLTIKGFSGLGDENYFFNGDPEEIVYNREKFFIEFLKNADNDVYWFTEPDSRIANLFPPLQTDLALLIRNSEKPITPAWRLARRTAISIFEEALEYYDKSKKNWNGDTVGWIKLWRNMGEPKSEGNFNYKDISIELRRYKNYCMQKSFYTKQFKASNKNTLIKSED